MNKKGRYYPEWCFQFLDYFLRRTNTQVQLINTSLTPALEVYPSTCIGWGTLSGPGLKVNNRLRGYDEEITPRVLPWTQGIMVTILTIRLRYTLSGRFYQHRESIVDTTRLSHRHPGNPFPDSCMVSNVNHTTKSQDGVPLGRRER